MADDYIQTVIINQKKVLDELADVERRTTVQALAIATQGATVAGLDRSVDAIVRHQVGALKAWKATKSGIDTILAQQQIQRAERDQDLVLRQYSHDEIVGVLHKVRQTVLAVGVGVFAGLVIAVVLLAWLR
jgi:hypothetical protein